MLLDFNKRQSGKTTRLVNAVIHDVLNGLTAVIVCHKKGMSFDVGVKIQEKLVKSNYTKQQAASIIKSKIIFSKSMHPLYKNFVDNCEYIKDEYLFLDPNAYYTATTVGYEQKLTEFIRNLQVLERKIKIEKVLT